ncbi:MAG TPA: hypothetical protein VF611_00970 [Pyrinomonadaceae bacterium]|jgi:hypothetical protein
MSKKVLTVALITLGWICGGGAPAQTREELREVFRQTYAMRGDGRVSLRNTTGVIRIEAWERDEVEAVKRAYTSEALAGAEVKVEASRQVIRINTKYSSLTNTWNFNNEKRRGNPASVDYILRVPRGARLDTVELVNGSLEITGLAGYVEASSVNGPIRASGLTGGVKLATVNGRLEAAFGHGRAPQPVTLTSVNGHIALTLPPDAGAELTAGTLHGRIRNDFGLSVLPAGRAGHESNGTLGRGGPSVRLNNVNGDIEIRAARGSGR